MIEFIKKRIRGEYEVKDINLPYYQETKNKTPTLAKNMKSGLASLFGNRQNAEQKKWKDIREGLKLKSIINSKRIFEVGQYGANVSDQKLIIQRHLGFKDIMPGSQRWKILTDNNSECWHCG